MHRLLKRQIKKTIGEESIGDRKLALFFNLISNYYDERDKERTLFENALVVNSQELTKSNEQLRSMAFYDSLTGLTNRKLFEKELKLRIQTIDLDKYNIALLFFDLDNFKTVNDTLGHDIGDELLVQAGKIIGDCISDGDILARWGGDEFVLLLDHLKSVEECTSIVKLIQKAFESTIRILDHELNISFSIGVNIYEDGQNVKQMIKNADMAMYLSKEAGRNQYSFYTPEIGEKVIADMQLNKELVHAVANKEFVVFYQPQVEINSGRIVGAEALVRWEHPEKGLLYPDEFINFSEDKGYIVEIGKQVLEQATHDMKYWLDQGFSINTIAVNLSVKQIRDKKFLSVVKEIIEKSQLNTNHLEFEITETILMTDYEYSFKVLEELNSLGITISIDDFGTGYSSLSYLKKLPINKIKIDKSFIDEIEYDENDVEITKAIIAMSHSLRLEVLAEGVENESQLEILNELRCDKYQGYYSSRPIPAKDFYKLLQKQRPKEAI